MCYILLAHPVLFCFSLQSKHFGFDDFHFHKFPGGDFFGGVKNDFLLSTGVDKVFKSPSGSPFAKGGGVGFPPLKKGD
jgi:hypothetical protein